MTSRPAAPLCTAAAPDRAIVRDRAIGGALAVHSWVPALQHGIPSTDIVLPPPPPTENKPAATDEKSKQWQHMRRIRFHDRWLLENLPTVRRSMRRPRYKPNLKLPIKKFHVGIYAF